jgi:hypothetical protein
VVYENRWMRLHEDHLERPDGGSGLYAWIEKPPAALIVPLDGEHVWLIEQFRHPVGQRLVSRRSRRRRRGCGWGALGSASWRR